MAKRHHRTPKHHRRPWTAAHVRRVFWRAGFGATPHEVSKWARRGRAATIDWLVHGDGAAKLVGPEPSAGGKPLDPSNEFGHHALWWLDRMVRSTRPLEEKMTLFWHDHFATRDQVVPLALRQNQTLRSGALGSFDSLLRDVTLDPAMQSFLSLTGSEKTAPNENFARELMELFTLGSGYSETDIREAARALTGFVEVRANGQTTGARVDPKRHDDGAKTIFGHTGAWDWGDVLGFCVGHPRHAPFLVTKLWAFFAGTRLEPATRRRLVRVYLHSGRRIAPVLRRILAHDDLYRGLGKPDMVKWPAVLVAGQLRATGQPVDRLDWYYAMASMGQSLFDPPSVAGWEWEQGWLSSNAMRARFDFANALVGRKGVATVRAGSVDAGLTARQHLDLAKSSVGATGATNSTDLVLRRLVQSSAPQDAKAAERLQTALRHLLISGPDNQLC